MSPTIDHQAEREAAAIKRICDLLGLAVPMTPLQRARLHAIEAAERGLPAPKRPIYNKLTAIKAFDRIARGGKATPFAKASTREDRQRRQQRRVDRVNLLLHLQRMPATAPPVDISTAVRLVDGSPRALHRAMRRGEINPVSVPWHGRGPRVLIPIDELRNYLARRLAPRQQKRLQPVSRANPAA